MGQGHEIPPGESREADLNGETNFGTGEGMKLFDELGPIPSFPALSLDPQSGRMMPLSREEIDARRDAALRMLKVLDQITDENDTDENWSEVYRNIDAFRPHRPLDRKS